VAFEVVIPCSQRLWPGIFSRAWVSLSLLLWWQTALPLVKLEFGHTSRFSASAALPFLLDMPHGTLVPWIEMTACHIEASDG
jgi:hypothetical protein